MRAWLGRWGGYLTALGQVAGAGLVLVMLLAGLSMPRWVQFAIALCLLAESSAIAAGERIRQRGQQRANAAAVVRWLR